MDLVEEVIEEILSRLPVKSLLRFRCVSKSWLSLISSDRFHKTHHQNSTKNRAVIFKGQGVLNQCFVHQFLNEASSIKHCPIYDPTNNDLMEGYFAVVGCCNGLLCIINQRGFHLWNPATMASMALPELELGHAGHTDFGFGWDRKSGACKVFVLNIHPKISEIHVYSSNTNSWKKTIDRGHLGESDAMGVFACGRIHWLTISGEQSIQSLDVASEEFGRIELPFNPPKFHLRTLAEIGGCLHLLCVHDHDDADADADDQQSLAVVWVMKEESGWLKLVTLSLAFELRYLPIHPLFGEGPNGEILIIFRDNFLVYYPTDDDAHEVRAGKMIIEFYSGHFYVETLVWPNFTTATSIAR